jgi:hypothetical protein
LKRSPAWVSPHFFSSSSTRFSSWVKSE